jgi:hypothetical protein
MIATSIILCRLCDEPIPPGEAHPQHGHFHRRCVERRVRSSWPPFPDTNCCSFCGELASSATAHHHYLRCHDACIQAEEARIAARLAEIRYDVQWEPGRAFHYGPADIRTLDRRSPEGQAELRRRAERAADGQAVVDDGLAPLLRAAS